MSGDHASAIVIGAGVFGASLARELAARDWQVSLLDPFAPGHARATSGDDGRFIRYVHRDDPDDWYTRSALRARDLWRDLGEAVGEQLLVPCGHMWMVTQEEGWEREAAQRSRASGVALEIVDAARAADALPGLRHDDIHFVLYEPDAGVLRARRGVQALVAEAQRLGATFSYARATPARDGALVDGSLVHADRIVWACGPWLASLFPDEVRLAVRRGDQFYFGAQDGWRVGDVPAWCDPAASLYGYGDLDGLGVKAMHADHDGPIVDPDHMRREPNVARERDTRRALAQRFPTLADAPLIGARVCQYELTADRHFVIAPRPDDSRVWLLGGGSGHGFKHGPALAQFVADAIEDRVAVPARFGLHERLVAGPR
ncbi:MAG TPA: FAD-dependent oxidoreductase [Conexibacter sp.]|nr:FAD-dependent oxidoreductase [Conexibacter sp.]